MARGYQAGSAYIAVLPRTTGFQQALRGELKKLSPVFHRGVIVGPKLTGFNSALRTELAKQKPITHKGVIITPKVDLSEARRALKQFNADTRAKVKVDADTTAAKRQIDGLEHNRTVHIKADLDLSSVRGGLSMLGKLTGAAFGALGSQAAVGGLVAVASAAASAGGALLTLPAAAGAAGAGLATLKLGTMGIADAFKAATAAQTTSAASAKAAASAQTAAGKQVESAQRGVETARKAVTRAERDLADATRGVNEALVAEGQARKQAERDAVTSARAVARAQRDVEDADAAVKAAETEVGQVRRRVSAESTRAWAQVTAAAKRVEDAEQAIGEAQKAAKRAQDDLTRARKAAREEMEDLQLSLRGGAIAEREALLDLAEAQTKWDEQRNSPDLSATDRERLLLDLDKAKLSLDEVRERNGDLTAEQQEWARTGVEGSRGVVDAQEQVRQSQLGVAQATDTWREADAALTEATNAARASDQEGLAAVQQAVAAVSSAERDAGDARQALSVAQEEQRAQQEASAQALTEAEQGVEDAVTRVADAQIGLQEAHDGVRQAQQELRDAIAAQTAAMQAATPEAEKLAAAMAKLSPNAQAFVTAVMGMKPAFDSMQLATQNALFEGMAGVVQRLGETYLPIAEGLFVRVATAINQAATEVANFLLQSNTVRDMQGISDNIASAWERLKDAARPFAEILVDITSVGSAFLPGLADAAVRLVEKFAAFVSQARDSGQLATWIQTGIDTLKVLGEIAWNVGGILTGVFKAGQDAGGGFLITLEDLTGRLSAFVNSTAGQTQLQSFFGSVATAIDAVWPLLEIAARIIATILAPALADLALQLSPIAQELLVMVEENFRKLAPLLPLVGEAVIAVVDAFMPLVPVLADLVVRFLPPFLDLIVAIAPALPAIAGAILGVVAAFKALEVINMVIGLWKALSLAFSLSPFGLVIIAVVGLVAALVTAYQTSETFRNIVNGVFSAVGAAAQWMWNSVLKPVWGWIQEGWDLLTGAIVWAWDNILKPAWDAVSAAGRWLYEDVLRPAFDGIKAGWDLLVTGIQWAWEHILRPVWDVVRTVAEILATILIVTIFGPILLAWEALTAGAKWAWENVLKPAWDAVEAAARWLHDNVLAPIFRFIGDRWADLMRGIDWVWQNVLRPVWDAITAAANWLWDHVLSPIFTWIGDKWDTVMRGIQKVYNDWIKPIWDWFSDALSTLKDEFDKAVTRVGELWDGLKKLLSDPINFVIREVWNEGIAPMFDWVADKIGLDIKATRFDEIKLATGGAVNGPGTGTSDSIPARLSNGEHVLTAAEVRQMGGQDAVYAFRQELMAGRPFAEGGAVQVNVVPGFANGGAVWQGLWDIVSKRFPNARLTSAQSGRSGGQHAAGKAIDVGGSVPYPNATGKREMLEINRWIADEYGASTRALIHTPGINLLNGKPHTYDAPTRAGHHNHVHWDANGIPKRGGGFLDTIGGWVGGAVDWVTDWINDRLADIASGLATPARALVDAIPMNAPPEIMGLPKKVGYKIIDSAVDWFTKRANDEGGKKRDADTGGGGAEGADSSVVDTVSNVFNTRGWGIGSIDWSAVDWIVNKESGWNPRAQNPVSTASGLFQHINSTWNAYKRPGTTASRMRDASVSQQAYAGMNYISKAYGTPLNARGFWQRNGWYDDGGWLPPGHTSVYNGTSKPEAVFTNEQWATLEANLRNNGGGADDPYSGPMIGEVNLYGAQDPQDAISELGWEARRMSRGGVFTGGRR